MKSSAKHTKCPNCNADVEINDANQRFLPFCSKRCQMADLGKWFSEEFRIAHEPAPYSDNDEDPES